MESKSENKYYLSNNLLTELSKDIKISVDNRNSLWTINKIESLEHNEATGKTIPIGKAVETLSLGDLLEYTDSELGLVVGKVCEIKEKEVLVMKPTKDRFLMGNYSQIVGYTPYSFTANQFSTKNNENSVKTLSTILITISIVASILLFLIYLLN